MILAASEISRAMLTSVIAAISLGALLIVVSRGLKLPAIVLLLFGGILLGPQFAGIVQPASLGDGLLVIVSLSIGLILFEGGLTLDISGYRAAPDMIKRLLTAGVLVTWFGTAIAIRLIFGYDWQLCIIAGSLVIVTGPTVIAPLLKRIKVSPRLHNILHWEGVLIDPIGVFIALLCFEWVVQQSGQTAVLNLIIRIGFGLAVGIVGGLVIAYILRQRWVARDLMNVFSLGMAVLVFGIAESVLSEAGLLAVTVAGFVLGLTGSAKVKKIKEFKAEITDLLIGTLFILLAARLDLRNFLDFGWQGALVVAVVMFVIRPVSIAICSFGTDLNIRERAFLSWVAPRGIVAASMASLIAISLGDLDVIENPVFVETFTYSVIFSTIVLQGISAAGLSRLLGVRREEPTGWLIIGAHALGRRLAKLFADTGQLQVVVVDSNPRAVREASEEGLTAITADARDTSLSERLALQGVGNVLALTDNEDLNVRLCQNWQDVVGPTHVFRCNPAEVDATEEEAADEVAGTSIWPNLPRPSLLSAELSRGEASILEAAGSDPAIADMATPLAYLINGKVRFELPSEPGPDPSEVDYTLYLKRRADYLVRSVQPELVMTVQATDLRDLLEQVIDRIVELYPKLSRDETIDELMEREASFPTALGHGVAVPHAFSNDLDTRLCAVVRVPQGIDFGATDKEPITLVFLLLSPRGDPEGHLATLADIARLVIDPQVRSHLRSAESPLQIMRIIRRRSGEQS